MGAGRKYAHEEIARKLEDGATWAEIAAECGAGVKRLQTAHYEWRNRQKRAGETIPDRPSTEWESAVKVEIANPDGRRIQSLEDLCEVLQVDQEKWKVVSRMRGSAWEQHSTKKGIVTLFQVRADFIRNWDAELRAAEAAVAEMMEDAAGWAPTYPPIERPEFLDSEACCFMLNIYDPHLGMLAWGDEVGEDQDLKIAARDYSRAVGFLLGFARLYKVEVLEYVVGHDFLHVDSLAQGARGGQTAAGTPQDIDSRLAKMFTTGRRALVSGIDLARQIAPVRVRVVPGNHDRQQMYRMGEVLAAWYRKCEDVEVIYSPMRRTFGSYGANTFMFTHGEEYARHRDNLVTIFATECPPDIWVSGKYLEVITGHNHALKAGRYHPTFDAQESRKIRTISLPGLTASDAWHFEQAFKHNRAATARVYKKTGGIAGHHEFTISTDPDGPPAFLA